MFGRLACYQEGLTILLNGPLMLCTMAAGTSMLGKYYENNSSILKYPALLAVAGSGVVAPILLHNKLQQHWSTRKYGGTKHLASVLLLNIGTITTCKKYMGKDF